MDNLEVPNVPELLNWKCLSNDTNWRKVLLRSELLGLVESRENFIKLLSDSDESSSLAQLLEFGGSNICASWTHSTQNVSHCLFYWSSVFNLNCFAFRSPAEPLISRWSILNLEWEKNLKPIIKKVFILRIFGHGSAGGHAIKLFEFFSAFNNEFSARLIMTCKHSTKHHKICSSSKSFRNITRACATSILKYKHEYAK